MPKYKNPEYEQRWIKKLKKILMNAPEDLWLFASGNGIHVMKLKDGLPVMTETGGYNTYYCITTIKIRSDGGDC